MAWDGMVWVKLNRSLADDEKLRQLKIDTTASEKPRDDFSVFSMNEVFLESTNVAFQQRGMFSYGFLAVVIAGLLVLGGGIYCLTDIPPMLARRNSLLLDCSWGDWPFSVSA
ncbi:hypothetical protein [Paraburkholderia fungorum]|uniref:hypothetical protein n=1 Tax=Paraburkholderia fungorum TaxID=134537 RepID=UPI000942E65C|nr:hypothetical protein [Paraburkholderia fungorum]